MTGKLRRRTLSVRLIILILSFASSSEFIIQSSSSPTVWHCVIFCKLFHHPHFDGHGSYSYRQEALTCWPSFRGEAQSLSYLGYEPTFKEEARSSSTSLRTRWREWVRTISPRWTINVSTRRHVCWAWAMCVLPHLRYVEQMSQVEVSLSFFGLLSKCAAIMCHHFRHAAT